MIVKFKGGSSGSRYHGFDGTTEIILQVGDEIEVSDAKAEQLLADFPKDWEAVESEEKSSGKKKK